MTTRLHPTELVRNFRCLAADCPDTCCHGWGMQVDAAHVALYRDKAPELLNAVTAGEAEHIMRRDPESDFCVKFTQGICGIHRDYGEDFLGDACHFYPRSTRRFGEHAVMSAALSCPEVMRLALELPTAQVTAESPPTRLPEGLRDVTPDELTAEAAQTIHEAIMAAGEGMASAEEWLVTLHNLARSLSNLPPSSWADAVPFYLKTARQPRVPPERDPADAYKLLQSFALLVQAGSPTAKARLWPLCEGLAQRLHAKFNPGDAMLTITGDPDRARDELHWQWQALPNREQVALWLKRWLAAELRLNLFPFAGLGGQILPRLQILTFHFCLLRLTLQATAPQGQPMPQQQVVDLAYNLARYLDHLADPTFLLSLIDHAGWTGEGRLNGLLMS